mgnify:FL=1
MNPILGFAPDAPTTTPGILLDCVQFIPYDSGMRAAPSPRSVAEALDETCRGAFTGTKISGTRRVFAGTATKLYELSGTTWSDVSRGAGYSLGAEDQWSFTQFGDTTVAACLDNVIQTSSSGAFADQATAPTAAIVESVLSSGGGFVLAFNTIDGTYGTSPDRWWCCALNDVTSWTPSVASQANTGRLIGGTGTITAAKQMGADRIVAYKSRSIYVGSYVGPPTVWSWQEIPLYGAAGLHAVADIGTAHFVVGQDNIYIFDGARPIPVADGTVRQWFLENSSGTYRYKTNVKFDRNNNLVWIFYCSATNSVGTLDSALVYHLKTGQWGRANRSVQATLVFNSPGETFDASSGTFDSDLGIYDQLAPGNDVLAIFTEQNQYGGYAAPGYMESGYLLESNFLSVLDSPPEDSSFTLCDVGTDDMVTRLTKAKLQYMTRPTASSVNAFGSMATGGGVTASDFQSAHDVPANGNNVFPLRQTARWHRLQFNFTGSCKVVGYDVPLNPAGTR